MFNLWKRRRLGRATLSKDGNSCPEMMGIQTTPGSEPDTVKLVESTEDEAGRECPDKPDVEPKKTGSLPSLSTTNDIEKEPCKLDICNEKVSSDDLDLVHKNRKPNSSAIKWADRPKELGKELTTGLDNLEAAGQSISEPNLVNRSDGQLSGAASQEGSSMGPRRPTWPVIPEESEDLENENSVPVNISSAETDDYDTDTKSNNRTSCRKSTKKLDSGFVLAPSFPGLRKDSIDMYKKKKQNQFQENYRSQASADTPSMGSSKPSEETPPPPINPGMVNLPSPSILKRRSSGLVIDKEVRQNVFTILSGMYAMFLTILGAVLPISEVFAHQKHPLLFEVFYIYMYGGSIVFLGYVYTYLLRSRTEEQPDNPLQKKKRKKRKVSVDKVGSHTGSFYLRLGAVAFGIGSMIHSGLQFGDYFEVEAFDPCSHAVFALRPIVHLLFTFVQLYFVFMNSKMCINRYKVVARFGLMHMVATNICVWFNTIVEETLHQLRAQETTSHHLLAPDPPSVHSHLPDVKNHSQAVGVTGSGSHNFSLHHGAITTLASTVDHVFGHHQNVTPDMVVPVSVAPSTGSPYTCHTSELMMTVLETVGPYLYPCSIEYSLICAGIIYTLWKNIGKRVMTIKSEDEGDEKAHVQRLRVDCSKSSRGLFLGILVLVGTIITMVVFFVLVKTPTYNKSAMLVEYLSEITLFTVSSMAVVVAALRMRYLRFNSTRDSDFEEVLILISLSGDYMFQMLSLVAALFDRVQFASRLSICASLLGIVQSTLQTIFVLDGLRRSSRTSEQSKQKHGRECVTFLLLTNIAMWCINTFESERTVANPVQMHYYGALAWSILTHISIPLGIFFRFHSTVCLSNIWKRAWKSYP